MANKETFLSPAIRSAPARYRTGETAHGKHTGGGCSRPHGAIEPRADADHRHAVLHLRLRDLAQRPADHLRQAGLPARATSTRSWCRCAFYLSYFFLSLPASVVLRRTGMKKGMALGLFVMAIGAAMFGQFVGGAGVRRRADRPVRDRRRPVAAADRVQPVHQHPRPDRQRRAAHRLHGHLQQDRRHPGAAGVRRAGAAAASTTSTPRSRPRRPPRRARPCSMRSPPRCTCRTW